MGWELKGYVSEADHFTATANGEYIFAQKDGKEYFIKRFPKYTFPSEKMIARGSKGILERNARCQEYFDRCKTINNRLEDISGDGGNLVVCVEMFRENNKIYKVYPKINYLEVAAEDFPRKYDFEAADRLMVGLTSSVGTLHRAGVIHSDIKYENNLIIEDGIRQRSRLSDFDDSFLMDGVPDADDIVGSPEYYSPELGSYIEKRGLKGSPEAKQITGASDIFALGLLYHVYLTGKMPGPESGNCYATLLAGGKLEISKSIGEKRYNLISWMLEKEPKRRPPDCGIIQQAINGNGIVIPDYWNAGKPSQKMPNPFRRKEMAAFLVTDEAGVPIPDMKLNIYRKNVKRAAAKVVTDCRGIGVVTLPKNNYMIQCANMPEGFLSEEFFLGPVDYDKDGKARRKLVFKRKKSKQFYLRVTTTDTYGITIKDGIYKLMNPKEETISQGRFERGGMKFSNLQEGTYILLVQPVDRSYEGRRLMFNTENWKETVVDANVTLKRKAGFEKSDPVRLDPPIAGICQYRDLQNGFYELLAIDGSVKRIREQTAKLILGI